MEEDFGDEDVELENSPLYLYLRDCENDKMNELQEKPVTNQCFILNHMNNFYHQVTNFGLTCKLNVLKSFFGYNESLKKLNDSYRLKNLMVIKNCSVLLEDDVDFLENVMNDEPFDIFLNETRMFTNKFLLFAVGLGCWKLGCHLLRNDLLFKINYAFATCAVTYSVFSIVLLIKRKRDTRKSLNVNEKFVKACEELIRSSKKCLMYIKELEIYGRGLLLPVPEFSLARVENSSLFVSNAVPLPKMCVLNSLRVSLFEELKKGIFMTRSAMFKIIKQYPTSREIDNEQNYIAFLNSKDLDSLLNLENILPESEDLSSSSLKCLFQLLHLHLSEILRRFCVCFCFVTISSPSKKVFDLFTISNSILKTFTQALNSSTQKLNEGYKLHSYFSSSWKKDYITKCTNKIKEKNSPLLALNSSLKGLSLHFLASLARIQEIVENLESIESESYDDYSVISSHLQLIQQDIKAGQFCLDESFARLIKLRGKPEEESEKSDPIKSPNCHLDPSIPVIPMSENVDIASEDQVFEAYVDSNEINREEDSDYNDELVDKIAVKQREISKTMFEELKNVLIPKAKEWKLREAKALGLTEMEAEEKIFKEGNNSERLESEDVIKVEKVTKREIVGDVEFVCENDDSDASNSPTNINFQPPVTFSNDLVAALASLVANRAKKCVKEECFESEG